MKLALLLAGALIPGPMLALEQVGGVITLTQEERAKCDAGGGCLVIPAHDFEAGLLKWMQRAYDKGNAAACRGT